MDLTCPACQTPLQATATDALTVIVCSKCSHVIRIPHDGGAHTLTMEGTAEAPPHAANVETTIEPAEETHSYADERPGKHAGARATFGPGERFGDYEILSEIAQGGMGVVYKARQISLNRIVALKMILGGQLVSEEQVRRFYVEAKAAARLDHPGIVPVYEVGQHQGRHFYSMGFVDGVSLSGELTEGPLPPHEAAEFMLKTARAVAYAHEQGVIHRDLKPSNILVDAAGQPRVTDFGLAKQVESESELTTAGGVLGTPSYMPPEQAAGRTDEVGALADVYSLGATLYCLLAARPPFHAAHVAETLRQVIEQEPVSPRQLNAAVDRDLETICLKCLEKEPGRRYASAAEFASDLDRYLEGRPIVARPIAPAARLVRWCRRNPWVAGFAIAFVLTLIGGTVFSTYFGIQASNNARKYRQALGRESAALGDYKDALEETEDSIYKYVQAVREIERLQDARFRPELRKLIKEALAHYRRYIERHRSAHDATTQAKLGRALSEVGSINRISGDDEQAIDAYQQAMAIWERLVRQNPGVPEYEQGLANSHNDIAISYNNTGELDRAIAEYEQALTIRKRLAKEHSGVTKYQNELAGGHSNIAGVYRSKGMMAESLTAHQEGQAIWERLARGNASAAEYQGNLAASHFNIGSLHSETGKRTEALVEYGKARAILEPLAQSHPSVEHQNRLASTHQAIGLLYREMGKLTESLAAYNNSLTVWERLARGNPTVADYQSSLAVSYAEIGDLNLHLDKLPAAQEALQKARPIFERLARDNPANPLFRRSLAWSHDRFGRVYRAAGKRDQALVAFETALTIRERLAQEHPDARHHQDELADSRAEIANHHKQAGKLAEAMDAYREVLTVRERLARENPTVTKYQTNLANCYQDLGRVARAMGQRGESLDQHKKALAIQERLVQETTEMPIYRGNLGLSHYEMAQVYRETNKPAEAHAALEKARVIFERLAREHSGTKSYHSNHARCYYEMGRVFVATGQPAEALRAWEKGRPIFERLAQESPNVIQFQRDLAGQYKQIARLHGPKMPALAFAARNKELAVRERLVREHPTVAQFHLDLAATHNDIGVLHNDTGQPAEAIAAYVKARVIFARLAKSVPQNPLFPIGVAGTHVNQAILERKSEPQAGAKHLATAIELLDSVLQRVPNHHLASQFLLNAHSERAELVKGLVALARVGEHATATASADFLSAARDGAGLARLGRIYVLSAAAATRDQSLTAEDRSKLADAYADKAIAMLHRAAKARHFAKPEHLRDLQSSPDFAPLRTRAEFRVLLNNLGKKPSQ